MDKQFNALLAQAASDRDHELRLAELKRKQTRQQAKELSNERARVQRELERKAYESRRAAEAQQTAKTAAVPVPRPALTADEARQRRQRAEEARKVNKPKPLSFSELMKRADGVVASGDARPRVEMTSRGKQLPTSNVNAPRDSGSRAVKTGPASAEINAQTPKKRTANTDSRIHGPSDAKAFAPPPAKPRTEMKVVDKDRIDKVWGIPPKPQSASSKPKSSVFPQQVRGSSVSSARKPEKTEQQEPEFDYRSEIWKIFGRERPNKNMYDYDDDDDDDDMEATGSELFAEEERARRIARREDEEEERKLREHEAAKAERKRRRKK